jgi:hypothetical protein
MLSGRICAFCLAVVSVFSFLSACADMRTANESLFGKYAAPLKPDPGEFAQATEAWRWLVPATAEPLLMTALGDVFVRLNDGTIMFLDTESGEFMRVAPTMEEWQNLLRRPEYVERWFRPKFVAKLQEQHQPLQSPYVYSPTIPLILNGERTPQNYTPSRWDAHLHVMGQIHRQVKDLPAGTPITKIHVEPW